VSSPAASGTSATGSSSAPRSPALTSASPVTALTHIPYPEVAPYSFTVAHYLGNFHVIRHWFVPGLQAVWTDAWPVVAAFIGLGAIVAIVGDRVPARRMLGVVTALGFAAYLATPTSAIGPPGQPILFGANTRYALPVFCAGGGVVRDC